VNTRTSCTTKFNRTVRLKFKAFSVIELLVVIGVVVVLIGILLPVLARSKYKAQELTDLTRISAISKALALYANDSRELPPVLFSPTWPASQPLYTDEGAELGNGNWFDHYWLYRVPLAGYIDSLQVFDAVGRPPAIRVSTVAGQVFRAPQFLLTQTVYADPAFWNWETQVGLAQFQTQALSRVLRPDAKGQLVQASSYRGGEERLIPVSDPEPRCVTFFDGSAATLDFTKLKPGMWNIYAANIYLDPSIDPREVNWLPVVTTYQGVTGADR